MATVHTRKNTTFADWRKMVVEELAKNGVDINSVPPLRIQHAYEFDEVPAFWAKNYADKLAQQANTTLTNKLNR